MLSIPQTEQHYPQALRRADLGGKTRIRSIATINAYRKRYGWLIARVSKMNGDTKVSLFDIAKFLRELAPSLRHASYRQYCAAFNQLLRDKFDNSTISGRKAEQLANYLIIGEPAVTVFLPKNTEPRTAARRAKSMSVEATSDITTRLEHSRSKHRRALSIFMLANQFLGLRPVEWLDLAVDGRKLIVKCAKYSEQNARGIAPTRTLFLPKESFCNNQIQAILEAVESFQSLLKEAGGDKTIIVRKLGNVLRSTRSEGSRITLRTTRHQAKSNFLASGMSHAEIAATMGHASASTSQLHYGQRNSGRRLKAVVKPDPNLVQIVRPGAWQISQNARRDIIQLNQYQSEGQTHPVFHKGVSSF